MRHTLSLLGVMVLGAGFCVGCPHSNNNDSSSVPTTQSADAGNNADANALMAKLQTDAQGKDWASVATDVQQLAPLKDQLTSDQQTQLATDQAKLAMSQFVGKKTGNSNSSASGFAALGQGLLGLSPTTAPSTDTSGAQTAADSSNGTATNGTATSGTATGTGVAANGSSNVATAAKAAANPAAQKLLKQARAAVKAKKYAVAQTYLNQLAAMGNLSPALQQQVTNVQNSLNKAEAGKAGK